MERGSWRRLGDVGIVVLAVLVLVGAGWAVTRDVRPEVTSAQETAGEPDLDPAGSDTPTPSTPTSPGPTTPAPSGEADDDAARTTLAVIGDGFATEPGWPAALASAVDARLVSDGGVVGSGYVTSTEGAPTFAEQVEALLAVSPAPDVVVLSGSRADAAATGREVQEAATAVIEQLRAGLPDAALLVVGPAWAPYAAPPGDPNGARQGVKSAAGDTDTPAVDPQAGTPWLAARGTVAPSGGLTTAGQAVMAERVQQALDEKGLLGG